MFSKKNPVDVKKSTSKIQDPKKDLATRIKHLKIIVDNVENTEVKGIFEANFSHVYNILYDSFIQLESNLRQRELSFHLVHKAHKEELETTLNILENTLCLLPELIHKRWQLHSIGRILLKLLHASNSAKYRRLAIRYFLMWYQALNENAPAYVHNMFATLVPDFTQPYLLPAQLSGSVFHDTSAQHPVSAGELLPLFPPASGERPPEHAGQFYLDALLEHMAHTVVLLQWHDKGANRHRCFQFLLERFRVFYLPKMCPNFSSETSLYQPNLELPVLRKSEAESEFLYCRVSLIMWVASYMHLGRKGEGLAAVLTHAQSEEEQDHPSLDSTASIQAPKMASDVELAAQIVREVLLSSRDNINFVHEMYRQAFLMNFTHVIPIRKIIAVYKDLIQANVPDLPPYMLEPPDDVRLEPECTELRPRLRNDSYLGAIHKENLFIRAGSQVVLQLFMTHASNVFFLEVNPHIPKLLEEQTDTCKRVLNIYRYMVMNTRMDSSTWEKLLMVLLQITSLVLGENVPRRRAIGGKVVHSLGGKLAPAIFQTLIVTWIKANLNVVISGSLWDRLLDVLTSLTHWEELIKEWAKTMETLTRVLARHMYNLDLTDLPLDRLAEQKKRGRRTAPRPESHAARHAHSHAMVSRQNSSVPDGGGGAALRRGRPLARSYSETSLHAKRRATRRPPPVHHRRSLSLDTLAHLDAESADRTRSPSPAPSSGLEGGSLKDSPVQVDGEGAHAEGVICGGAMRGWLPDVAVILWRRMLGALGDVNAIAEPKHHAQVFEHLVKLTDTLIRIKMNQGVSADNASTPTAPEFIPPVTLILPWCFGALSLSNGYENGKLNALRLLCTITLNCDQRHRNYLPQFYRFLHNTLTGSPKSSLTICLKYLGPRFLSLQLPGSSLLLLDLIHSCNLVLNSNENLDTSPRTEAISIIANLLSLPTDLSCISVLEPEEGVHIIPCPDVKEHVVSILLRGGRREPKGRARCIALSALGMFVYKELTNRTFHPKVADAVNVILMALKFNNKVIAQLASNILYLLCDHASLLWSQYPRLGNGIIRTLCAALFLHAPLQSAAGESDKALGTALLLCLGEWCMKLEPKRLLEVAEYGEDKRTCLLLQVFKVLYNISVGKVSEKAGGLSQPNPNDDFDPYILFDDLVEKSSSSFSPSRSQSCQKAITLCAKTVLAHLVTHLGHFPMAIGAARLSSLVVEHDDVPNLTSDELSANIFSAPNIQLFMLTENVIASLIELPVLDLPGGGVTAGLSTADKQVRVLLRDLSGKASWDASILYKTPDSSDNEVAECKQSQTEHKWGPMSHVQPESFMASSSTLQRAMRHRSPNILPDSLNSAPDLDQLDDLLQYLGHSSPECLDSFDRKLNEPATFPLSLEIEQEAIASVITQRNVEIEESRADSIVSPPISRPGSRRSCHEEAYESQGSEFSSRSLNSSFQQCRLLFSQLGLASWERRKQLHLLNKTERLLRELRNLDAQPCRETHKVAVIYVAAGQEDRTSILSNQGGSAGYEQFLAALAWEVELEAHTGFLGGLQRQGSNGPTAPYVASSFAEAIFHVATRMPGDTNEAVLGKTRHLGNDEVHIVWSEHCRDYRRDIIPTEFCDILIAIYPLGRNGLNRVTVDCKPEVPHFGILFHEAIVESNVLAGLVRATAICASRAKRTTLPHYQQYYEERATSLETVVTRHKHSTTYEDFISCVYSPIATPSPFCTSGVTTGGAGDGPDCAGNRSMLAAALLDSHGHSHRPNQRGEAKFRASASDASRIWPSHTEISSTIESASISPRPLKKMPMSRRSLRQEVAESPPDSPQQSLKRK